METDSPPLARGLRGGGRGRPVAPGLTPAGAGTSHRARCAPGGPRTHPRWRGDFSARPVPPGHAEDSPPLARGLHLDRRFDHDGRGLTPAGAGTSPPRAAAPANPGTHPRWRGDFPRLVAAPCAHLDSPPLARGLLHIRARAGAASGLTPAGAGTSLPDQRILARPCLDSSLKTQVRVLQGVFLCPHHGTSTSATAPSRWVTVTNCRPSKSLTSYGWSPTRRISNP